MNRNKVFFANIRSRRPFTLNISLECAAGELLALVGASGSGKSTLLRMVAGLTPPQAGRIVCNGMNWFDSDLAINILPQQRKVGYVPQHYGLFPHMSALENVCANLLYLPKLQRLTTARQWLERMHITEMENRRPAELSGGQQQRVAVARALAGNPSMLLLDEPFSALDSATREKLHGELAELRAQLKVPILMVTHDLREAMMLADSVALIHRGTVLQSGPVGKVVSRPASLTAAHLVGMPNILDCEIVAHDKAQNLTRVRLGSHMLDSPCRPELKVGEKVCLAIPNNAIRFRAISRPDEEASQNRLEVVINKILKLGDEVRLTLDIVNAPGKLRVAVPVRLADELEMRIGQYTNVTIRIEDLHIISIN